MTDRPDLIDGLFPESLREAVEAELRRYPGDGKEAARVRRAVLVLSGGKLEDLKHYVDVALQDYRDVLFWAEHPEEDPT